MNHEATPMDTNDHTGLLLKEEVYRVVGSAIEVLNTPGHGLAEKPYENARAVEFEFSGIPFQQQRTIEVVYKGRKVGTLAPEWIAFDKVVVDAKVIDRITDIERGQMLNHLKITGGRAGVILNFKRPKLEWERLVL